VIPATLLDDLIDRALAEDAGAGDVTSAAVVSERSHALGRAVAKAPLVVAGGEVFARVFARVDPGVRVECVAADGRAAATGDVLWIAEGATRSLLMAERTALNFVQRLAGIATLTRQFVDRVPNGSALRVTDTRKTTPGLRFLERAAVRAGGGMNHRNDLGSAILIKDNHIAAAGGVGEALRRARAFAPHTSRLEVEVETLSELDEALENGADIVLLDNFAPGDLAVAVARTRGRALVEVSGGVGLERIEELGRAGVDFVSVGRLTHSAPSADISFEIEPIA
jgi:nicotinate-nucleotide pyrophosphorylase (carboxylating)